MSSYRHNFIYRLVCNLRHPIRLLVVFHLLAGFSINIWAADWVRAGIDTNELIWGFKGGLLWAISPAGFPAPGGPRGLIRIGFPASNSSDYQLVNYIAIEPIVHGQRGYSELEQSQLDHQRGKRIWVVGGTNDDIGLPPNKAVMGKLTKLSPTVEQLDVNLGIETFENGAQINLTVSQRSDFPDEVRFIIHKRSGSKDFQYCVLTATMGNKARLRQLWLRNQMASSRHLFPNYKADGFTPHQFYSLDQLCHDTNGDVLVCATTDEENPASVFPFPGTQSWHFRGASLTQYWKQLRADVRGDLQCAVNGRYMYWQSEKPIPNGIAFENFELREQYYDGQEFIYGISRKAPRQLMTKQFAESK